MSAVRVVIGIALLALVVIGVGLLQQPSSKKSRSGSDRVASPDPAILEAKRAAAAGDPARAASPAPKVDLPEASRKAIYLEAARAEARAEEEASAQAGGSGSNPFGAGAAPDRDRLAKQEMKRKGRARLLAEEYRLEVAKKHGLADAQILEILEEGRANHWPAPK